MGITEEAGKVATTAVTSLGGSPGLLAMIVLNLIMIFGVGYVAKSQVEERRTLAAEQDVIVHKLIELCRPMSGALKPPTDYAPSFADEEVKPR